jgi:hypothetical protein
MRFCLTSANFSERGVSSSVVASALSVAIVSLPPDVHEAKFVPMSINGTGLFPPRKAQL